MEQRRHGERVLVGAALAGARSIHQPEAARPLCPWCSARLGPGRVLWGWEPGARRRTHACLACDGSWSVVDDPAVLVDALAAYWLARREGERELVAATARLRALHLDAA